MSHDFALIQHRASAVVLEMPGCPNIPFDSIAEALAYTGERGFTQAQSQPFFDAILLRRPTTKEG